MGEGRAHLWASIHKKDSGVLPPWLHGVGLVDHAIEPHVGPRVEMEDFRRHVSRGAACGDKSDCGSEGQGEPRQAQI